MDIFNIVSLNCFGIPTSLNRKTRFENIAKEIIKIGPELVLLQEVWMKRDHDILEKAIVKNGYRIYPTGYSGFGPGGLVLFSKNINIENYEYHKFKNQGPANLLTIFDRLGGKSYQKFELDINGKKILVFNAHLMCGYHRSPKMLRAIRSQLKEIEDSVGDSKLPLIIAGDLNLQPLDTHLKDFKDALGLKESLADEEITIDVKNLNRGPIMNIFSPVSFRTDYIFINSKLNIESEEIIFKEIESYNGKMFQLSDHFGIFAKISC